jgi:hypothetical protein
MPVFSASGRVAGVEGRPRRDDESFFTERR